MALDTVRIPALVLLAVGLLACAGPAAADKNDDLLLAAFIGKVEDAERLLSEGADINVKATDDGATPLIIAVQRDHTGLVRLLLGRGAKVNVTDDMGQTAVMYATNDAIARMLLEKGADVNVKDADGATLLMRAARQGRVDVVRLLLARGGDVNAPDSRGWTPLIAAIDHGYDDVAKLLLRHGADVNAQDSRGWTPAIHAASAKERDILKLLLEKGADPNIRNKTGYSALMYATDDPDTTQLLIRKGADVNARGTEDDVTPLIKASVEGQIRVVEILLKNGVDVNAKDRDGKTALHWALKFGHARVADLLRSHGATE